MREAVDKLFKTRIQKPVVNISMRKIRNLALLLFAAGFFCFFIFGGTFIEDLTLLDSASLKQIRDVELDKGAFFRYLCLSHMVLFILCGFLWWYQWGKACMYVLIGLGAMKLGLCLAVVLMRYRLKGIVLWVVLYFPHVIFYFAGLLCGMVFCQHIAKSRAEKVQVLFQNILWLLCALGVWLLGVYFECYISSGILQTYLQYF